MNRSQNIEVPLSENRLCCLPYVFCLLFSVFCFMFYVFCSLSFAETTIKVLLLDSKDSKIPTKGEKLERLGNKKGEMLVGGIKYSGVLEIWKGEKGLYVVNEIPLEEYVKGVVAGEVSKSWDIEALKAQAVVARTYALYQKLNSGYGKMPFHITSSVLHQIYKGGNVPDNIEKAVRETKGEILTYEGQPIVAYYHSTSGGMTEEASEVFGKSYPYLKPVETVCDLSPYYVWERSIPVSDIEKATNIAEIKDIFIDSYTVSKRAKILKVISSTGVHRVVAKDLRKNLGWDRLPSTMITKIKRDKDSYIFEGRGYGHGVGMCQWSALEMARSGKSYKEILSKFYPGTVIERYKE